MGEIYVIKYSFLVIGFIVLIKGADLFVDGANQTYILGFNTNIVIKASGDLDKLQAIEIDNGNMISSSNYQLASGSIILTLLSSFLENTSIGEHTINFRVQ